MQETKYVAEDGEQKTKQELFYPKTGETTQDLISRMNERLFELESEGHVLVEQRRFTNWRNLQKQKKLKKSLKE